MRVSVGERVGQLDGNVDHRGDGKALPPRAGRGGVFLHVRHHDVEPIPLVDDVVNGRDVGMTQLRRGLRFTQQTGPRVG